MTFASTPRRRLVAATLIAFALGLALLSLAQRDGLPAPTAAPVAAPERHRTGTPAEIARLQAVARRAPAATGPRVELAAAYLQRARETGDASLYGRADALLRRVLAREPRNAAATVELAGLALSRHDFRLGLTLARRAQRLEPASVAALPPLVDALVELGRYRAAERALQRLVDLQPTLSGYSRVSYLRELRGDLRGAASALALAAAAGGPAAENVAAVEVLRGDLALVRGRRTAARRAYATALTLVPGYAAAAAGRARLAAHGGDLRGAIARWRRLVARRPLPEYAIALGEAELAAGREQAGRESLALVRAEQSLPARAGVNTDAELALYEADHGDRARRAAGTASVGRGTGRPLGGRAGVGAHPRGPPARGPAVGAARAAPRLRRPAVRVSRRRGRARGGRPPRREPSPALRARARARDPAVAGAGGAAAARGNPMRARLYALRQARAARRLRRRSPARARFAVLCVLAPLACLPSAAHAHPLGNFSVNHVAEVSVSADRVDVRYLLDQAEIPTFQQRGLPPGEALRRIRAEVARGVRVTVDGRAVALRAVGSPAFARRPGAGGLPTTRFELALRAPARGARRVVLRDDTFRSRVGWRAIVARPGRGTAVRADAPATDPTHGLTRYPAALLDSPADQRVARLDVRPGDGTLVAGGTATGGGGARADDGFAGLFADAAAGEGVLALLLLAAVGWGAVHALSPGHGKAMVAAYLVGTRGTARQAVALGATVTVTHTAGVALLGLVALTLSQYVLPEDLYPWLNLVAGLLVLGVGAAVLRGRLARRRHHHHHDHNHVPPERLSARGLVAIGASAGLIPCPSALVVLLGAVAQHQIALGLLLIVAFSAGLAATLTALGLAVVWSTRAAGRLPVPGRALAALPTVSAIAIVGVGILLTLQALPQVT